MSDSTSNRKQSHLDIVMNKDVSGTANNWEKYRLPIKALPEVNLSEINTDTIFFGKKLSFPFLISSMTGGTEKAAIINENLAKAAQTTKVALGLGSMRIILENPDSVKSFQVRKWCPDIPLFANLGLVQLNYGVTIGQVRHLVDIVEADGIFLHINPMQEAIQPEGDTNFSDLLKKLELLINKLDRPIIVKEVGNGFDKQTMKNLSEIGITWLDTAGAGGTSWVRVEGYRRGNSLGELFASEAIPTDEVLKTAVAIAPKLNMIASGGIRSGIDGTKAMMLGAKMFACATPLLKPTLKGMEKVEEKLCSIREEFRIAMFACGLKTISDFNYQLIEKN